MTSLQSESSLVSARRWLGLFSLVVGLAGFAVFILSLLPLPMASSSEPHLWPLIKGSLVLGWFLLTFMALVAMTGQGRGQPSRGGLIFISWLERVALLFLFWAAAVEWLVRASVGSPEPAIFPSLQWDLTDWLGFLLPLLWLNALGWDQLVFLPALTRGHPRVRAT